MRGCGSVMQRTSTSVEICVLGKPQEEVWRKGGLGRGLSYQFHSTFIHGIVRIGGSTVFMT